MVRFVSDSGGGEQISLQVSSEGVDRWPCSNGQWQTVQTVKVEWFNLNSI